MLRNRLSLLMTFCVLLKLAITDRIFELEEYMEANDRLRLTRSLLEVYERHRIPTRNSRNPVNVSITMWPYDVLGLNEARSSIKVSGWFDMTWNDYHLVWDPSEFGNITHTFLPAVNVWLPGIDIYYSKEDSATPKQCVDCYVKVEHTGEILYGKYFVYSFPCTINVKYFPFDEQSCFMQLANWHLDDRMMDLYPRRDVLQSNAVDLSVFLPNEEWDILSVTVDRKREYFNYGFFPSLAYTFSLKRKPFFYICNLVVPSLIITITAVIGYHLPSTGNGVHQEKVKMGLTTILSIFILQLGVADKLPRTADVVPLINIFYSSMVSILSLAIVSTGLVILVEKQGIYGRPVPVLLQQWVLGRKVRTYPPHLYCNGQCQEESAQQLTEYEYYCNSLNGRTSSSASKIRKPGSWKNCSPKFRRTVPRPTTAYDTLSDCTSPQHRNCGWRSLPRHSTTITGVSSSDSQDKQHQQLNHDDKSKTFKPGLRSQDSSCCDHCDESMRNLNDSLTLLQRSLQTLSGFMRETKEKTLIKKDWSALADIVERISLFFFVSISFAVLIMFFYHDWY